MEQAPDTVNVNLLGPFPPILGSAEPGFASTQLANVAKANASPSPQDTSTERCSSPTETIRPSVEVNAGSITPQTTAERAFQHGLDRGNLEQEVGQVLGTLNSWWGGVKQQSVSALTSFKADLDKTVIQAQADLEYLRTAKIEVVRKSSGIVPSEMERAGEGTGKGKEKEANLSNDVGGAEHTVPAFPQSANAFLNRLTSSTNQLQQTLQTTLQSTLASAASNPAITNSFQLRAQLAENLRLSSATQNLQLSMKQAEKLAEEYLRKGDRWVKDAEKWMGEAVKVVPPEGEQLPHVGLSWDGSDWYSFSTSSSHILHTSKDASNMLDPDSRLARPSTAGTGLAGSRKEALLRRLREDKELLLVDPSGEAETEERRREFSKWISNDWARVEKSGREAEEGHVGGIRMALVPEPLTDEEFWQRYLFHKHMIEAEEERRKLLLAATQQSQLEDFSWDDDSEELSAIREPPATGEPPATPSRIETNSPRTFDMPTPKATEESKLPQAPAVVVTGPLGMTSASTSPRDSEESYDLVSDQGTKGIKAAPAIEDEEDSDWE